MTHVSLSSEQSSEISALFSSVFTASEGEGEGKLVGGLAEKLSLMIDNKTTLCYGTFYKNQLIATIFFTELKNDNNISVHMLAPVAVSTKFQGQGYGKSLISFGLEKLKEKSCEVVVTYGDPNYYSKFGFERLSESCIQAPLKMSMPEGWLGQSLTSQTIPKLTSKPKCVEPFNNPIYW